MTTRRRLRQIAPGRYGVSPTSTSPGVAAHFASEAGTAGGTEGVLYVIPRSSVAGRIMQPQRNALLYEFEVPLDIAPLNIPVVSVRTVPAAQARSILDGLGYPVPSSIYGPESLTPLLKQAPAMTPAQTEAFLKALGL